MTYLLTPRQDRIRVLLERIERLDAELGCLIDAEKDDRTYVTEEQQRSIAAKRQAEARAWLLKWAETAEFRARLMQYGRAS